MAKEGFLRTMFGEERDEYTDEEWKAKQYEDNLKTNPFVNLKSIDPTNGIHRLRIFRDSMGVSIEESYYWFMRFMRKGTGADKFGAPRGPPHGFGMNAVAVYKLKDVFDASVASSFHGQIGTKITAIQQQVSNTLSQIGQLIKTIFPIVREIRIMDERLDYYKGSFSSTLGDPKARENEIALKSTWIEVVEQGMQNPNSVYSMATKLGFITLPDLFFAINPHGKDVETQRKNLTKILNSKTKGLDLNLKVKEALTKKLVQYYTWKAKTYNEMSHTWKFRIKNLRQHYNVIRLYMSWLKPYLTSLKHLQMKQSFDKDNPDLVSAFETSKLELELLGEIKRGKKYSACLLIKMDYVTRPEMTYTPQGQKQPTHIGHMEVQIFPFVATQEEIEFYKEQTDKETLKYFTGSEIDMVKDIEEAMSSLGSDIEEYIREAETGKRKKEVKKSGVKKEGSQEGFFEPFSALIDSFKDLVPDFSTSKEGDDLNLQAEKGKMAGTAAKTAWWIYDIYKKAHGMYTP